eukprot:gene24199-25918_t
MHATIDDNDLKDRLDFVAMNQQVRSDLTDVWTIVEPKLAGILRRFYDHLRRVPRLAALIGDKQPPLVRAQETQWARLFGGRFDEAYVTSVRATGRVHHRIGLEPRWYIGAYKLALNEFIDIILAANRFRPKRSARLIAALNTAVFLDLDFAISVYQDAMLESRLQHTAFLEDTFRAFTSAVEGTLRSVEVDSGRLQAAADELSTIAGNASAQARSAAGATEETAAKVGVVASASDELAGSSREIARQAADARTIVERARAMATQSSSAVEGLAVNIQLASRGTSTLAVDIGHVETAIEATHHSADGMKQATISLDRQSQLLAADIRTFIEKLRNGATG